MKSSLILILGMISAVSSFAVEAPTVSCDLTYTKKTADGVTVELQRGESVSVTAAGVTSSNSGFLLNAKLQRVCAAGASQYCFGYKLSATVSNGASSSLLVYSIPSAGQDHVGTGLTVADEHGLVNCYVENK